MWRDVDYDYVKQRLGDKMSPELYFALRDEQTKQTLRLVSRSVRLDVCRELIEYLDSQAVQYKIN